MSSPRAKSSLLVVAGLLAGALPVSAQNPSNAPAITVNAAKAEAITLTVNSGGTVDFDLDAGTVAPGDVPVNFTVDWTVQGNRTELNVWGAFASAAQALGDGNGYFIPSSAVEGQVTTGVPTTFTAFTSTAFFGAANAGLLLVSPDVTGANRSGSWTGDLGLRIDQTGLSLPAGTFTGTLTLQATAF